MRQAAILFASVVFATTLLFTRGGDPPRTGPATEKRFPPLKVPPGFKATLFACDPMIEYPSVIAAGPRPGSIFVAIDYMTGLVRDGKVKSEIRLIEDTDGDGYADKSTVVATGFNSIQGLLYHEGKLFVMHAPFLTSLQEKAQGRPSLGFEERKDLLTGLGLKPEENRSRLHCANGIVAGHDGWLYLALGDNGVNVPRPEGDRLVLQGGGILRCRPDGRDLHVFSTGLRNIYDIALDAELNVFTRDNENDGGTYMIRVCHSFFGADHGYPYDYEERPDHGLKPIGDFGLGSSAGGVCYLETQFPPAYRGNLFFCEWGKSLVRYELKRAAAGFAPVKELDFATGDPRDVYPFKPTDIVVQRDGTLMVSDYADGQEPKRGRGRIYHFSYVGQDSDPVKPIKKGLNSPSYHERCQAQSALERGGIEGLQKLKDVDAGGRMHVMWALARLGPDAVAPLLRFAEIDRDPRVRAQAVRALADLTDPMLVEHKLDAGRGDAVLAQKIASTKEQDPRVLLEIVIALGRLRWTNSPAWLAKHLVNPDAALSHAAMQTLRRADNWPTVLKLLDQPTDAPIRRIALRALSDQHEFEVVDELIRRVENSKDPQHRREYASLLARVYKKPGPWKYWGYRPGPRPANTQAWDRSDAIAQALDKLLADPDSGVRFHVFEKMQREKVSIAPVRLTKWLDEEREPERAAKLIAALGTDPSTEARRALYAAGVVGKLSDANRSLALDLFFRNSGPDLRKDLLNAAADLSIDHGPVLADVLRRLGRQSQFAQPVLFVNMSKSKNADVRAAAVEAMGSLGLGVGREPALQLLADPDVRVRRAAVGAAGKLDVKEAIEPLLKLAVDVDVTTRRACLESLTRLREPRAVPIATKALNDADLGSTALACLAELGNVEQMAAVVHFVKRSPTSENLATVARGLMNWQTRADAATTRQSLDHAIAEIQGSAGVILRWHTAPVMPQDVTPKFIKRHAMYGATPEGDWTSSLSSGIETRLLLKVPKATTQVAFADLIAPEPMAIEFLGSARGDFELWLNGKSIHRRAKAGKYQIDSDRFPAKLDKGGNRVVVQTSGLDGSAEFHLRFRRTSTKAEHEKLTQTALSRTGNAERGRKVFFDKDKSQCLKCHAFGNQGERIGPDLTGVGARFSRIHIIESILEPSRTIAPSFGTYVVTLKSGKTLNGVKNAEDGKTLTLADNQGQKHVLMKTDIEDVQPSPISTMPEGLELRFTADEFVDLIAFLTSQK